MSNDGLMNWELQLIVIMLSSHLQIYVNLDEYDDQEYVNFDMKIDE